MRGLFRKTVICIIAALAGSLLYAQNGPCSGDVPTTGASFEGVYAMRMISGTFRQGAAAVTVMVFI